MRKNTTPSPDSIQAAQRVARELGRPTTCAGTRRLAADLTQTEIGAVRAGGAGGHTPEPWNAGEANDGCPHNVTARLNGETVVLFAPNIHLNRLRPESWPQQRADLYRAVACVNACTGMTDPEKEVAELRKQRDELAVACEAVALLADSLLDSENLTDHDCPATCPACSSRWSVRECRIMLSKLSGECQCGKWSFDVRAAIARARGAEGGAD